MPFPLAGEAGWSKVFSFQQGEDLHPPIPRLGSPSRERGWIEALPLAPDVEIALDGVRSGPFPTIDFRLRLSFPSL